MVWACPFRIALMRQFHTNMNTLIIDLIQPFCTIDKHKLPLGLIFMLNKDELQLIKELLVDTARQFSLSMRAQLHRVFRCVSFFPQPWSP